jgi:hypothetical protein
MSDELIAGRELDALVAEKIFGVGPAPATSLTPERLAELRRLEKAATKGEWHVNRGRNGAFLIIGDRLPGWRAMTDKDTEFIAAFRNAAPALLDAAGERDRLREALRHAVSCMDRGCKQCNETQRFMEAKHDGK